MTPTIRSATSDDTDVIARFNTALAIETEDVRLDPHTITQGVRAGLADDSKALYFLAEVDRRVVGQIMITHEWSDWRNGDIWWIQSVYVEHDFRRRGVFRALYQHVIDRARSAGAVGVRLYVDADNITAQQTYEVLGMRLSNYKVMETMFTNAAKH